VFHDLGKLLARRHRWIIGIWAVLTVLGFAITVGGLGAEPLFDRLTTGVPRVPSESEDGRDLLARTDPTGPAIQLLIEGIDPRSDAVSDATAHTRSALLVIDGVLAVADPYQPASSTLNPEDHVSVDGDAILVTAVLEPGLDPATDGAAQQAVAEQFAELGDQVAAAVPGSTSVSGSIPTLISTITAQSQADLRKGELVALPLSLLVMIVVFGGFLAAGLPIVGAIASIAGALMSIYALTFVIDFDASAVTVVTVLGLGLCIDYGLLLVSRYREELREGLRRTEPHQDPGLVDLPAALGRTLATAGRTVAFSGTTVAISLTGLLVFHSDLLRGIGAAGISIVVVALLVALTLVPALMAAYGVRLLRTGRVGRLPAVRRLGDVAPREGVFSRLARTVQRRPWLVVAGTVVVLVLLAVPSLSMRLVSSGVGLLPVDNPQRHLFDTIAEEFPALSEPPVTVVAEAPPEALEALAPSIDALDQVTSVDPVTVRQDTSSGAPEPVSVLGVRVEGDQNSDAAREVVTQVRALTAPLVASGTPVYVTGDSAQLVDFVDDVIDRAPWAITIVVLATFVLLFLLTGSVLVPVKALAMNVVSLGAAFGILVWVFQEGHLEDLLNFTSTGGIETFIPPLILAFGFGLAMDYEVFLLARIKELKDGGLGNDEAVVAGLQRSGRIITSAALVIIVVFSGFVAGDLLVIKETGVALAVAVAIDATLVRMLLVPATMTLLGEWNWWAPGPLRRLHDRLGLRKG
jgi:RND superfamily putative drug exporter